MRPEHHHHGDEHRRGDEQQQEGRRGAVRHRADPAGHPRDRDGEAARAGGHPERARDTGDEHRAQDRATETGTGVLAAHDHAGDHGDHHVEAGEDDGGQAEGAVVVDLLRGRRGPAAVAVDDGEDQPGQGERHDPERCATDAEPGAVADQPGVGPDPQGVGGLAVGARVGEEPADHGHRHEGDHHRGRGRQGGDGGRDGERAALRLVTAGATRWAAAERVEHPAEACGRGSRRRAGVGGAAQQISHRPSILAEEGGESVEARG